jgi:peptidoglycan/xylan/chitin deacetylase (PgdA/CDA1 family)
VTILWRLAVSTAVLGCLALPASAATRVVFTIDVESNEHFRLPDQVDAVCADGSACGLSEIVRRLRDRQWSGTFFLNVYERQQWGDSVMRKIAVDLDRADQDVELHTHPHWMYDPSRWAMYQYDAHEQTAIVGEGIRLLRAWTGRPVVAHRAGAYTADERTLLALDRNGVALDSSRFWQAPDSRLDSLPRNLPSRYRGVTEIPVSVYQREDRTRFGAPLGAVAVVRKIDPNWFADADEAKSAIDGLLAANVPVLVVFLHSFSFMTARAGGGAPVADRHAMDMFRQILDQVASHGLCVLTMRDIAEDMPVVGSSEPDIMPRVGVPVSFPRYVWHGVRRFEGVSLTVGVGLALLCAGMWLGLARRRSAEGRKRASAALAARTRVGVQ